MSLACCIFAVIGVAGCNQKSPNPLGQVMMPVVRFSPQEDFVVQGDPEKALGEKPPHEKNWVAPNPRPWKFIVLHHSATGRGNASEIGQAHQRRGFDELGYHFVITNGNGGDSGKVEIGSRWISQKHGAHTGGTANNEYNEVGIGICMIGDFSNRLPSKAQLDSLEKLLRFLVWKYKIKVENVIGHRDAPEAHTNCPGDALHKHLLQSIRKSLLAAGKSTGSSGNRSSVDASKLR